MQPPQYFLSKPNTGFDFQAKKFPRFKEVHSLWRFDYAEEEKKRFRANGRRPPELMWDPHALSSEQVEGYLNEVYRVFKKKGGMTEEIALKYLVSKEYNVIEAIYGMQSNPQELKEGIMKYMNRAEERCESIKYILTLQK